MDEHPSFIEAAKKEAGAAADKNVDESIAATYKLFNALPDPGIGDIFIKDSLLQYKYSFRKNNHIKAIAYLDSMAELVKDRVNEEKYAERYASVLYEKGECFRKMKLYDDAFRFIILGNQAVLNLVKNKCNVKRYGSKKGYLLFAQEKYLESAASFKEVYDEIIHTCNTSTYDLQRVLNNIALCYLKADVLDSAIKYQQAALNTIAADEILHHETIPGSVYTKAVIYGDQGEVLAKKGQYDEAAQLYIKSIAGTQPYDIGYAQNTEARLADCYLKNNKNPDALKSLSHLKTSLDSFSNETQLLQWHKLMINYYARTNNIDSAFTLQQQYEQLRDSIAKRDKAFLNIDIGKEYENVQLKYNNTVLQKESNTKSLYIGVVITVFIIAIFISVLIWFSLKRSTRLHRQVQQKNEDLQKTLYSLEQSHDENSRIIRIVAHDLKNPISAVNNLVYSLLRKNNPGELTEILLLIKTACTSSMSLIREILEGNKKPCNEKKDSVNMKRLLEYSVDLLQAKADEKNQLLTLEADNIVLPLNRQSIWRVISNLINNSIKFSPEHTVITIKLQKRDSSVLLSVTDKGIGIPVSLSDKILNSSPETSRPGTNGEKSYGLGLSITKKIVEEHDGKIWFESVDGQGSVFYIELPFLNLN